MPSPSSQFCATCKTYGSHTTRGHAKAVLEKPGKKPASTARTQVFKDNNNGNNYASNQSYKGGKGTPTCFLCNLPGHLARACPRRAEAEDVDAQGQIVRQTHCFNCGFDGHLVGTCEVRINLGRTLSNRSIWQRVRETGEDYTSRSIKAQPYNPIGKGGANTPITPTPTRLPGRPLRTTGLRE